MKKNLIIVLMMAVIMPLYFLSDIGYLSQSRKSEPFVFPQEETDTVITDESALNSDGVELHTAVMGGESEAN